MHPLASHDLPNFIVIPGEADTLFAVTAVILILGVIGVGVLYFNLHSLPERMSHRANRVQMEFVAVLCLLALFTHNHALWIVGLLLAFIRIPDFETPIYTIADSLRKLAGQPPLPSPDDADAAHAVAAAPGPDLTPEPTRTEVREGNDHA